MAELNQSFSLSPYHSDYSELFSSELFNIMESPCLPVCVSCVFPTLPTSCWGVPTSCRCVLISCWCVLTSCWGVLTSCQCVLTSCRCVLTSCCCVLSPWQREDVYSSYHAVTQEDFAEVLLRTGKLAETKTEGQTVFPATEGEDTRSHTHTHTHTYSRVRKYVQRRSWRVQ